ncbi:hypothetical protein BDR26DRAFT_345749 [Obelidium mucronatum]|nr:hypothetical protein BDR26DRAFT_345749 [Obelidium mucronatum]
MMPILLSLFANHFPGIFGTLYVLNFGWLHSGIWSIVKRALSAEACKKLLFLTKEEMLEYFDRDLLLSEHGGTCTVSKCSELFVRPAMTPMQTPSIYPTSASSTAIKEIWSPGMVQTLGLAVVPGLELLDLELPESAMGDGSSTVVEGCEQDDECMRSPRSDVPQTPRSMFLEDSAGNSDGRSVGYPRERVSWTTTGAAAVCGECSCCKNRRDDGSSIAVRIWALGKGVVMSPWNLSLTLAQLMVDASTGELFCRECRRSKAVKKREVASVSKGVKVLATIILASSAIGACWKYARFALSDKDRLTRLGGKFITVLGCIGLEGVAGSVVDLCFGKNPNINNT